MRNKASQAGTQLPFAGRLKSGLALQTRGCGEAIVHHWFRGRYLAFARPSLTRMGRSAFLFGLFDAEVRRAFGAYVRAVLRDPRVLARRLHLQTVNVEQPFDLLPDGGQDHCDGCPNMTLWKDRLVAACQLEEYLRYGAPVQAIPRAAAGET